MLALVVGTALVLDDVVAVESAAASSAASPSAIALLYRFLRSQPHLHRRCIRGTVPAFGARPLREVSALCSFGPSLVCRAAARASNHGLLAS